MFVVNKNPTPRDIRWLAGGFGLGLPLLALLVFIFRAAGAPSNSLLTGILIGVAGVGALLAMVALASPAWGRKIYVGWMTLTLPIGLAMSTLLLTILYFLVLPVFSLIVRRRDPLRKKLGGQTYWENYRRHEPTLDRMRRPF
jgi:hypothetical protein